MQVRDSSTNSWFSLNILKSTGTAARFFKVLDTITGRWKTSIEIDDDVIDIITGPKGDTGQRGERATVTVGTVTTGASGTSAVVNNDGTTSDAILSFVIPKGDTGESASITVGSVTTLTASGQASVTNVGTEQDAIFNFAIPRGLTGLAATTDVGTVTTGAPGTAAKISNSGDANNAILNFTIPSGDVGATGAQGYNGGIRYTYSTTVTEADPGSGKIRFNNTNLQLATYAYMNNVSLSNSNMTSWYESFDDNGNTIKGHMIINGEGTPSETVFAVTGITAKSGFYKVAIVYVSGVNSLPNNTIVSALYVRSGDKGDGVPAGGSTGQLVVKTPTGYGWSPNLVSDNYGFTTGVDTSLLHLQNYYSGIGYLTQNLRRDGSGNWNLDNNTFAGAGLVFQTNPGVDTGKIHMMTCAPGYDSGSLPATTTWDIATGRLGLKTQSPTADLDVNGTVRFRHQLFDSLNSNGATGLILGNTDGKPVWVVENEAGRYGCSAWKTTASSPSPSIVGVGVITKYDTVWHNDGQLNTTTGVYTVPKAGLYRVAFSALKANNNTSTEVRLFRNGVATGVRGYADSINSGEFENLSFEVQGNFQANDTLDIRVTQGAVLGNESCYLNICKVR